MDGKYNKDDIRMACWNKKCFVYYKPVEQGKNKMVKLEMDLQGNIRTGTHLYKQDSKEILNKIDEMYLYIYEKYLT